MSDLRHPPLPFDPARAARTLEDLAGQGFTPPDAAARALLEGAFGNSAYLARLGLRDPGTLEGYFTRGAAALLDEACEAALAVSGLSEEAQAMAALRQAKRRAALAIALSDIAADWDLQAVTAALSRFADAVVRGALRFLLTREAARTGMAERDPEKLEAGTGLLVLAMGKEIRRPSSSTIPVTSTWWCSMTPPAFPSPRRTIRAVPPRGHCARAGARLIAERVGGDYVFRVDLRLRPDAGAPTQVAISTEAARWITMRRWARTGNAPP